MLVLLIYCPAAINSCCIVNKYYWRCAKFVCLAHFGLPCLRPWDNRGKCHMDENRIQYLSKASLHVPIYLQPFPSNSIRKFKSVIFHLISQKPPWTDLHQIWLSASSCGRNHVCQILYRSFRGFDSVWVKICHSSLTKPVSRSPLTQCSRYRAACDCLIVKFV